MKFFAVAVMGFGGSCALPPPGFLRGEHGAGRHCSFRMQGSSLAGGKRVSLAFCFSGTEVAPVPVGPDAAVAWTVDGEVESDSEQASKTPAAAAVALLFGRVRRILLGR